jgi:hypothetical protein
MDSGVVRDVRLRAARGVSDRLESRAARTVVYVGRRLVCGVVGVVA